MKGVAPKVSSLGLAAACAAWLCCVLAGVGALVHYSSKPGVQETSPALWPRESNLPRHAGREQLVVFIHPKCPCSRASVRQLERALAFVTRPITIQAAIFEPAGVGRDWSDTSLVAMLRGIDGIEVVTDRDGAEALRFGAATSGSVMLYDAAGGLVFSGGVTPGRGHEGDCAGLDALTSHLGGLGGVSRAPVYGCAIVDAACAACEGGAECQPAR